MKTISREKYEAGIRAASPLIKCTPAPEPVAREAVNAFLAAAGVEVAKTPEERIAAFVAAVRVLGLERRDALVPLAETVASHFPELREP